MARSKFKPTMTVHKGATVHTLTVHARTPDDASLHFDWNKLSKDDRRVAYKAIMDYARSTFSGPAHA